MRRASEAEDRDEARDVEAVQPVSGAGSRALEQDPDGSDGDRRPDISIVGPFSIGFGLGGFPIRRPSLSGFGGLGGFGPVSRAGAGAGAGADSDADSSEEEGIPDGYVPTGFLHPYFVDPMSNFMTQMAEMMTAMRRQMNQVLNRLPPDSQSWGKLGNTTSTTKVIDGHVVTVNETTINNGDENSSSVIHVRVVDVHPSESPEEAGAGAGATTDADDASNDKPSDTKDKDAKPETETEKDDDGKAKLPGQGPQPQQATNEIPKVGSEVDDLNA